MNQASKLSDQGGSSGGLVLPVGIQLSGGAVVSGQSVNSALNQDKSELGVLVLLVALQVLSHSDGLLNQHVQILGDGRGKA